MVSGQSERKPDAPVPAPGRAGRRSASWWRKVLLLATSLLVSLVLLEAGVRLVGLDKPLVWVPDPVVGWRQVPGARRQWNEEGNGLIVINRLGYRDRERQLDKPAGTLRIAFLGDSMTEGVQVNLEQTFTYLLEEKLSAGPRPVEVLNFGMNGYGPPQELLLFREEGPRYRPDLVVLAVFTDNDIADCHPPLRSSEIGVPFASVEDGRLRFDFSRAEQSHTDYHTEPVHTIRKCSALYRVVSDWRSQWGARPAAGPGQGVPKRFQLYQKSPPAGWEKAWATLDAVLAEFAAEARQQQTQLVVLSVPCGQVANPEVWQQTVNQSPGMAGVEWDLEGPERRLAELARKHGLPLIQPYRVYQQASQDPPLFFGGLGHFTPRGHELMAEVLEGLLREHCLVPGPDHH